MGSDEVAYATQSASSAVIKIGTYSIKCDILTENRYHAKEQLYIAFDRDDKEFLLTCFEEGNKSPKPLAVQFVLKHSYFFSLKNSVRDLQECVISRILPQHHNFSLEPETLLKDEYNCSPDQYEALKVIASTPASGPPVLIAGPFGTGKTRVLAIAAHYFTQKSMQKGNRLAILVCTQQHVSADAYLRMYLDLRNKEEDITIIRLMPKGFTYREDLKKFCRTVDDMKLNSRLRYLVVSTCLTAKHIRKILPPRFFTHIFLDEGAQMREPEAVAPLCLADENTKLVIAGDRFQVKILHIIFPCS